MMIPSDDPQQLSLLFHLNSEPWLNEDAYRAGSYHHEFKQIANVLERVALPPWSRQIARNGRSSDPSAAGAAVAGAPSKMLTRARMRRGVRMAIGA